RSFYSPLR
ncbi:hypothetical protein V3C99_014389, partial [Haemonchus contortus]